MPKTQERGIYEKIVLRALSGMRKGSFTCTLPSGEIVSNGNNDGCIKSSIKILDNRFFKKCVLYGDVGFGEAYMAGYWESDDITAVIKWFLLNIDSSPTISGSMRKGMFNLLKFMNRLRHLVRKNSIRQSKENIAEHYDLSNDFFKLFLDSTMTYSSALFKIDKMNLEEAQLAKYETISKSIRLKPRDRVLEIGSGWGAYAVYIAKHYNCNVTAVTLSEQQYQHSRECVEKENLTNKIEIIKEDYRNLKGKFDKIVSIEMLEAVGHEFLDVFFKKCLELLKPNGVLGIQVITCPDSRYAQLRKGVDWIQKYIFPGSLLPSVSAINNSINRTGELSLSGLREMGLHYARTLNEWKQSFNNNLAEVKKMGFDETFIRKWNYYFCYCEAAFLMRNINVMQMIYTFPNNYEF
jgi:cyclopropane-fatty-acyl-phospholipid synthase